MQSALNTYSKGKVEGDVHCCHLSGIRVDVSGVYVTTDLVHRTHTPKNGY